MRHCARSTFLPDMYGGQTPRYLANYSDGGELPDWGVPPTLCTARGRSIVVGQGRSLRAEVLSRIGTEHLKVVYDAAATRDNTTALDFLTGLGLPSLKRMGAAEVFDPPEAWCPLLTEEQKRNAVSAQLGAVPRPKGYTDRIAALQKILGRGVAPPMQSMPDVVSGGDVGWIGGSNAASSWIEAMLLQLGAGLPMAYGRVTPAQLYDLLELHVYYRAVAVRGLAIERRGESNLLAHMMRDLLTPASGASLYVGHDTNLDGIAQLLDLAWDATPYPTNTTVPGGILRLTASGTGKDATVSGAFLYSNLADGDGKMREVEASFGGKGSISLAELSNLAKQKIDARCVRLQAEVEQAAEKQVEQA